MIKNQVVITHRDCPYLQRKRSSVIEWGMSLALVIAFLIFSPSVRAAWSAAAFLPQYNLNVSFDVEASKIFGRAEINAKAGSMTIHTDNLKIIEATVEGKKTDFTGDKHKIALEKDGIVKIIKDRDVTLTTGLRRR